MIGALDRSELSRNSGLMENSAACYRAFGLNIVSQFEIPGAIPVGPSSRADIAVSAGSTAIDQVEATSGPYSRSGEALLFDAPGVARYLARSCGDLLVEPHSNSDPSEICALLIATALPMLLWMRGGVVLHAAGVVLPGTDQAIALAGPSGVGKSSLAQGLLGKGARIIGDDSLWLVRDQERAIANGLPGGCFLPQGQDEPRRFVPAAPLARAEAVQLKAMVVLRRCDQSRPPELRQLRQGEALEALLKQRHRPRIPAILGREAAAFHECVLLSRLLPIYQMESVDGDIFGSHERIAAALS